MSRKHGDIPIDLYVACKTYTFPDQPALKHLKYKWTLYQVVFSRLLYNRYGSTVALIKKLGPQEFDLPQNVIDIIYSQTLCW